VRFSPAGAGFEVDPCSYAAEGAMFQKRYRNRLGQGYRVCRYPFGVIARDCAFVLFLRGPAKVYVMIRLYE
jgi:hypothetical protein